MLDTQIPADEAGSGRTYFKSNSRTIGHLRPTAVLERSAKPGPPAPLLKQREPPPLQDRHPVRRLADDLVRHLGRQRGARREPHRLATRNETSDESDRSLIRRHDEVAIIP